MIKKYNDHQKDLTPLKSFKLKDYLNPKIWHKFKLDHEVKEELLQIGNDFIDEIKDDLKIDFKVKDIIFTGSLANYNWSEWSDIDLHIVLDFTEINDDENLVQNYLKTYSKLWNEDHDILIGGYELELNCQTDIEKIRKNSGVYSILYNYWVQKPDRKNFEIDYHLIKLKAEDIMDSIDDLEIESGNVDNYENFQFKWKKIWKKIKDGRKSGIEKDGEYSLENLVFKLLRRNKYIEKLINLRKKTYDKQFK